MRYIRIGLSPIRGLNEGILILLMFVNVHTYCPVTFLLSQRQSSILQCLMGPAVAPFLVKSVEGPAAVTSLRAINLINMLIERVVPADSDSEESDCGMELVEQPLLITLLVGAQSPLLKLWRDETEFSRSSR